jgi:outer membrane protein OmpA-like peptidoglycan-associated protein
MGPTVNTAGMEGSVFIAADGRSLYFSSNGRQGYGGYDMYLSRRLDESWTKWSEPINLGGRINSEGDDYYYTIPASGEYAYYASERDSYGGADLYRIRLPKGARPLPVTLLSARILDGPSGDPLPARLIRKPQASLLGDPEQPTRERSLAVEARTRPAVLILPRGPQADAVLIEARDHFPVLLEPERVELDPVQWMDGGLSEQEYRTLAAEPRALLADPVFAEPASDEVPSRAADAIADDLSTDPSTDLSTERTADAPTEADVPTASAYRSLETDVRMMPLEVGNKVLLEGVFFSANKANLRRESTAQLDMVADFLMANPGLRVEVGGHTNGLPPDVFCEELSTARAKRVRSYLIDRGVDKDQLEARGYGKTQPIASNTTLEGRRQNQRVELTILALASGAR